MSRWIRTLVLAAAVGMIAGSAMACEGDCPAWADHAPGYRYGVDNAYEQGGYAYRRTSAYGSGYAAYGQTEDRYGPPPAGAPVDRADDRPLLYGEQAYVGGYDPDYSPRGAGHGLAPCPHAYGERVLRCDYVPRPQEVRLGPAFFQGSGGVGPAYIAGGGGGFVVVDGGGMASAGAYARASASAYASARISVSGAGYGGGCGCR